MALDLNEKYLAATLHDEQNQALGRVECEFPTTWVLVVDDDPFIIRLIKEILPSESYKVTGASNGHAAIESLSKGDFDVLLVDKQLPDMNGDEVCRRVRDKISQILPIIVVTGCDQA